MTEFEKVVSLENEIRERAQVTLRNEIVKTVKPLLDLIHKVELKASKGVATTPVMIPASELNALCKSGDTASNEAFAEHCLLLITQNIESYALRQYEEDALKAFVSKVCGAPSQLQKLPSKCVKSPIVKETESDDWEDEEDEDV